MEQKKVNALIIILSVTVLFAFATSSRTIAADSGPRWGGTYIVSIHDDPPTLNPLLSTHDACFWATHNVYSSLIIFDFNMTPQPNLAQSWSVSSDGLTYTFNLVHNAVFHDGVPLTSADVKFSMEEVAMKHSPYKATVFAAINHVETPDNYTAVFKLNYPYALLMTAMNFNYFVVLPKHLFAGTDIVNNPVNNRPVGSGPYKFVDWIRGDHLTLERYDKYFKSDKPYFDRIVCRVIPDEATVDTMLAKGEIDYLPGYVLPQDVASLKLSPTVVVDDKEMGALSVVMHLCLNNKPGHITSDAAVRRAIAYAIDKAQHLQLVDSGLGKVGNTIFSPYIAWCYNPNPTTVYTLNVTKANEILDAAGYPRGGDGTRFHLKGIAGAWFVKYPKNMELLINELSAIGIQVDYEKMDKAVFYEKVFGKWEYDLTFVAFTVGPDPSIGQERYLTNATITGSAWANLAYYNNSRVDLLCALARNTSDINLRKQYFFEIQDILSQDVPYVGMYAYARYSGWSTNVIGLPKGPWQGFEPDDNIWFADAHKYSPSVCSMAIKTAAEKIAELENKSYDVSSANSKLGEAKAALTSGDYTRAKDFADLAPTLAIAPGTAPAPAPPYELWTAIIGGAAAVVVAVVAFAVYRQGKKQKKQ